MSAYTAPVDTFGPAGVVVVPAGSAAASMPTTTSTTKSTSTSTTTATGPQPEQVIALFVLTLLFIVLFFFLASLPRAIARFNQKGAWRHGWLLKQRKSTASRARDYIRRSMHLAPAAPQRRPTVRRSLAAMADWNGSSEDTHESAPYDYENFKRAVPRGSAVPPSHVPSWSTIFHPVSAFFRTPLPYASSYTIGQTLLYVIYGILFLLVTFVGTSGTANLKRAGWLVVAQMPLMIALGSKNSLIGLLVGRGYEKVHITFRIPPIPPSPALTSSRMQLNYIHRYIGMLMFFGAIFHVIGFVVMWLEKDTEAQQAATHLSAWVALAGFSLLAILSLPVIRRSAYNVFYHAHWIGYMVFLVAVSIPCLTRSRAKVSYHLVFWLDLLPCPRRALLDPRVSLPSWP